MREYFAAESPQSPYWYIWGSLSIFDTRFSIAGLFATNPGSHFTNGPLWTIPIEATMYLWVGAAGTLRLFRFPWLTSLVIAGVFSVLILWPMMTGPFVTLNSKLSLQGFFGAGAIAYLLRRHIPVSTGLMIVIAIACLLARHTIHATPFVWLAVTYFVFWFSYVPRLPAIPNQMDLSYGVYIWAWPIQQTIVQVAHVSEPLLLFAITTAILVPIAAASWFLIEKPALGLKDSLSWRSRALQPA
jgi:peptidoglycan/LPS O-acetylase OafA/YrhL